MTIRPHPKRNKTLNLAPFTVNICRNTKVLMGGTQGGRIMGSLGTRFPGNLKVSQEILIVNPTHLSRKMWYNQNNRNFIRKLLSITRNKVLVTEKILLVHKRLMLISRGGTNPVTGSTWLELTRTVIPIRRMSPKRSQCRTSHSLSVNQNCMGLFTSGQKLPWGR